MISFVVLAEVLIGASLMLLSIASALRIRFGVESGMRPKWLLIISLLAFFFAGYIIFAVVFFFDISFPLVLITGSIFFIGAVFVFLVISLAGATISRIREREREIGRYAEKAAASLSSLKEINEELEKEIAEHRQAEKALRMSEGKYRSLVESTEDSIYVLDRNYRYLFINKVHMPRLGASGEDYMGRSYSEFHSPEVTERFKKLLDEVFETGISTHHEHQSERDREHYLLTLSPVREQDGKISAVTVVSKKVTHMKLLEERLRNLTLTDELTGLYNRRGFLTLGEQHLKIAARQKNRLYMLYADLDDLKGINDTFGHNEGDAALTEAGAILKEVFRDSDIVARIGGDEFAVMPIGTPEVGVKSVVDRLAARLRTRNAQPGLKYQLSISVGFAAYDPGRPCSLSDLLSSADSAMYDQKKARRKTA